MRIVSEEDIVALIDRLPPEAVLDAVADGFRAYSAGLVSVAPIQTLGQPPLANFTGHPDAQACIKSAYVNGGEHFVSKVASGGGGQNSGLVLVFSQRTFAPVAILCDGGLLTELRTAAAGAIALRRFAPPAVASIGVIGCGVQARWQLRLLASVTSCRRVTAWARRAEQAEAFAAEMRAKGWEVEVCASARAACEAADVVLTVTPAREPLVMASWLSGRPALVLAIGADSSGKQELEPALVAAADLVVADSRAQCVERGEIQHAVAAGLLALESVAELGECLAAPPPPPGAAPRLVVFDATGVAVQDVAIAEVALKSLDP